MKLSTPEYPTPVMFPSLSLRVRAGLRVK